MHMVRSGSSAAGTVVEDREVGIMVSQVSHVRKTVPDRLLDVTVADYGEMVRKYRVRVYADIVFAAFAPLEFKDALLFGTVGLAEETASGLDRGGVNLGRRGTDTLRIVLQGNLQASDCQFSCLGVLETAEVGSSHRPYRELVAYEFPYFAGFTH